MTIQKTRYWLALIGVLCIIIILQIPICPSRVVFGVLCPGCGLTRGTLALAQGDLESMLHFNPLAIVLGPLAVWVVLHGLLVSLSWLTPGGKLDLVARLPRSIWIGIFVVLVGVWGARIMGFLGGLPSPLYSPEESLILKRYWFDG